MKQIATLLVVLALAGCDQGLRANPEVRAERFDACLKNVPAGPQHTKYNDWAEVVRACESAAYYQSLGIKEKK